MCKQYTATPVELCKRSSACEGGGHRGAHGTCLFFCICSCEGEVDRRDCSASFCIDFGPMWTPDVPGIFPGDGKWPDFM